MDPKISCGRRCLASLYSFVIDSVGELMPEWPK